MSGVYEEEDVLNEYLLFHYGSEDEILEGGVKWPEGMREGLGFAVRTTRYFSDVKVGRGLDLGCAVGRSSFEMLRGCEEVLGIDYSRRFVEAACEMKEGGGLEYFRKEEGAMKTKLRAEVPEGVEAERVKFLQGDAMRLPEDLGVFDRVHAANLLCRLSDPSLLLRRFPELVRSGGELVLATPCTWLEQFTRRENWPVGRTLEWLKENLLRDFDLVREDEEPFLIRETARKFQWTRSMVTVWERK